MRRKKNPSHANLRTLEFVAASSKLQSRPEAAFGGLSPWSFADVPRRRQRLAVVHVRCLHGKDINLSTSIFRSGSIQLASTYCQSSCDVLVSVMLCMSLLNTQGGVGALVKASSFSVDAKSFFSDRDCLPQISLFSSHPFKRQSVPFSTCLPQELLPGDLPSDSTHLPSVRSDRSSGAASRPKNRCQARCQTPVNCKASITCI